MSDALANLVWLLHVAFVLWMVLTPFSNNEPMLVLHLFVGPFLWMHWLLSDDTCSLTLLESYLRGVPCDKSFFHSVVSPVYKIQDDDIRAASWVASVVLWLITLSKVMKRPAMISDMFKVALYGPQAVQQTPDVTKISPETIV